MNVSSINTHHFIEFPYLLGVNSDDKEESKFTFSREQFELSKQ